MPHVRTRCEQFSIKGAKTTVVFVTRCALACALAYEAAARLGALAAGLGGDLGDHRLAGALHRHPLVADLAHRRHRARRRDRRRGRLRLARRLKISAGVEVGLAVALAAYAAHRFPTLRVAMWTGPVVLLTADASQDLVGRGAAQGRRSDLRRRGRLRVPLARREALRRAGRRDVRAATLRDCAGSEPNRSPFSRVRRAERRSNVCESATGAHARV